MTDKQMTLSLSYGDRSGTYTGEVNEQGVPNGKGKFTTQNAQGNPWIYEGFDVPADSDINGMKLLPNKGFGKATPIQLELQKK